MSHVEYSKFSIIGEIKIREGGRGAGMHLIFGFTEESILTFFNFLTMNNLFSH